MFYGTPPRANHRAIDDGGFAVLIRNHPDGRHRHIPPPGEPRRPRPPRLEIEPERAAHWLTRGLATLIMLGIAGMIGFVALADSRRGGPAETVTIPAAADPLASRAGDATPLSASEVFPDEKQVSVSGSPYPVSLINSDADCRTATTGTLGGLLGGLGCSQVVRAGMTTPAGDYAMTAGVFNLADAAGAASVSRALRQLVETDDGGFASMVVASPGADPATPPGGQVGWRTRGHYLLYCVLTRTDGQPVANDDRTAVKITSDLLDGYLSESVLGHRVASV
jgi:hypothetical protein